MKSTTDKLADALRALRLAVVNTEDDPDIDAAKGPADAALAEYDARAPEGAASDELLRTARALHASDYIQIDDGALTSTAGGGVWVSARLWVGGKAP